MSYNVLDAVYTQWDTHTMYNFINFLTLHIRSTLYVAQMPNIRPKFHENRTSTFREITTSVTNERTNKPARSQYFQKTVISVDVTSRENVSSEVKTVFPDWRQRCLPCQDSVTLCTLGMGTAFGESILNDSPRHSTVVTREYCELLRVEQKDFRILWEVKLRRKLET